MDLSAVWNGRLVGMAYSLQPLAPPYQQMENDVRQMLGNIPGGHWLDIGCGSGRTTQVLLEQGADSVIGIDISPLALSCARKRLETYGLSSKVSFQEADISKPLPFIDKRFDGIMGGLSFQYAESKRNGQWTLDGYKQALRETYRVLKPQSPFVWTVNVPDPDFARIVRESWQQIFLTWKLPFHLPAALFLKWQSSQLKLGAEQGRFHYLPIEQVKQLSHEAGFTDFHGQLTYADQAYAISCCRP